MSIEVMAAVFRIEGMSPTKKLILLALADHAGEDGSCYPSISRLGKRTGLRERGLQKNIRELEAEGYVTIQKAAGPKGVNVYVVHPTPVSTTTGAQENAPPHQMHLRTRYTPAPDAPRTTCNDPRTKCTQPPARGAPKTSGNHQEPSVGGGGSARAAQRDVEEVPDHRTDRERILEAIGLDGTGITGRGGTMLGRSGDMAEFRRWRDDLGLSLAEIVTVVEEVMASRTEPGPPSSFSYFTKAMQRAAGAAAKPALTPIEGGRSHGKSASSTRDPHARALGGMAESFSRIIAAERAGSGGHERGG